MTTSESILRDISTMPNRCCIPAVLNKYGFTGHVAEVGVDRGNFASVILGGWLGKVYYAVDLWARQDPRIYPEVFDHDFSYRCASDLAYRDRRVRLMKMYSVEAARQIPNNFLDWVWIDANHDFGPVFDDMTAWWPKVKHGGIFSGHDYPLPTVMTAVQMWRFLNQQESELVSIDSSWYMVKP